MTPEDTSFERSLTFSTDAALRRRFTVVDEPVLANVRVGLLLEALDRLAEETALSYLRQNGIDARVVTAAMTNLRVLCAPSVEQDLLLQARINFVGSTSMEIGIRVMQDGLRPRHVASCYFIMVARSPDKSATIPPLEYSSSHAIRRALSAAERRVQRTKDIQLEPPTLDEYMLLHHLHQASEQQRGDHFLIRELVISGWERTYPEFENVPQMIFGGHVIHHAYVYAHLCAELVAPHRPLLVAAKRIDFHEPVRMGDKLHFVSQVTYTGRCSIEVETSITRISRDRSSTAVSNNCLFTFVNVDEDLHSKPVPKVYPLSFSEDARYLSARRRHQVHLDSRL